MSKVKLSDNAKNVLKQRYCRQGERPEDIFDRVAEAIGKASGRTKEYKEVLNNLDFLPNSPCIRNAGYSNQNKACFTLPVKDSLSSIFKALHNAGVIFKSGGGVGYNFSDLREKGASISSGGESSGAVSFMSLYNSIIEVIKAGGFRRGASMGILEYDHPEIMEFLWLKAQNLNDMTNFNLSVMLNDEFMKKVKNDGKIYLRSRVDKRITKGSYKARELFYLICSLAWKIGDPGLLFFENINKDNIYDKPLRATNPCGELPLFPYESCCLGSINLAHCVTQKGNFSKRKFKKLVKIGSQFLLDVNKMSEFPIKKCYEAQYKYNRIGLGVMGFADMLCKMGIYYDSDKALKIIDMIGKILDKESRKAAPTSASTTSIAPTGTLSIIANCSPSIEPIFSRNYTRNLSDDIGSISEKRVSEYVRTSHEVNPDWHLKVQARWQKYINNAVSKTINLRHSASVEDVRKIYMKAWEMGCKGITVFRDGCRGPQVFKAKCDGESCHL